MPYPPAPWTLQGDGFLTVQPTDRTAARRFVPDTLEIVPIGPNRTLGGLYVGHYGPGSTLQYSELIVVSALVRQAERIGAWISHIYVDNPDSMAGGRSIWGLPKELAQFCPEPRGVTVRQDGRTLCVLRHGRTRRLWRQRLPLPVFSVLGSDLLYFTGEAEAQIEWGANACWEIPPESPLFPLALKPGGWSLRLDNLRLVARPPSFPSSEKGRKGM